MVASSLPRKHGTRRPRGRAASLLEFALLTPLLLFMVVFAFEMGRMALTKAIVSDAAYSAARHGAATGAPTGAQITADYRTALSGMPFIQSPSAGTARLVSTASCTPTGSKWVVVEVTYPQKLVIPGLARLVGIAGGSGSTSDAWVIKARASVMCEVTSAR